MLVAGVNITIKDEEEKKLIGDAVVGKVSLVHEGKHLTRKRCMNEAQ